MVDREARNRLALTLRRLAAGRITNDECDDAIVEFLSLRDKPGVCDCGYDLRGGPHDRCPECGEISDPALPELANFAWSHYGDVQTYRLNGRHALTRAERRAFARAIVFLKGDREYTHELFGRGLSDRSSLLVFIGLPLTVFVIASAYLGWQNALVVAVIVEMVLTLLAWMRAVIVVAWTRLRSGGDAHDDPIDRGWPYENNSELREATMKPVFLNGAPSARDE